MKEIPILFSTPMVKALLEGRKTQTRRIVKPNVQEIYYMKNAPLDYHNYTREPWKPWKFDLEDGNSGSMLCPYGEVGSTLWVRETWAKSLDHNGEFHHYIYKADADPLHENVRWKPSIHMPKAATRIWLEVESIRVERLQDISEEDAIAEGVEWSSFDHPGDGSRIYYNYLQKQPQHLFAVPSYQSLWQSIHGPESWEQNPFVWVITFKRIAV